MGKGMRETNECSRQESGNVETIVNTPHAHTPPHTHSSSGRKEKRKRSGKIHTCETHCSICIFIHIYPHAGCLRSLRCPLAYIAAAGAYGWRLLFLSAPFTPSTGCIGSAGQGWKPQKTVCLSIAWLIYLPPLFLPLFPFFSPPLNFPSPSFHPPPLTIAPTPHLI